MKPWHSRLLVGAVATLASLAAASRVGAETDDRARAQTLFLEGRDAMRRQSYAEACDDFRASDALDPSAGTTLNWALCAERLGHLVEALEHARWALDRLGVDDVRYPIASRTVASLESRVARITLRATSGTEVSAHVYLDGTLLPPLSHEQTRTVDPGPHEIRVEVPRHQTNHVVVSVGEGEIVVHSVLAGSPRPGPSAESPVAPMPRRASTARSAGYVLGGVALANVVAAAVLTGLALSERGVVENHCPSKRCDETGFEAGERARTFLNAATLTFSFGVADAAGAGVLLWVPTVTTVAPIGAPSVRAGLTVRAPF